MKYTFVLFSTVTPQSDGVTASGFSISCLSGRDWCALPVSICSSFSFSSCGGFLFSFCSSGGPFSFLFLYWHRVRIPCDTIDTRGLLDFETFYPTDPRITDRRSHEQRVCEKLSDFRKSLHVQSGDLVKCDF